MILASYAYGGRECAGSKFVSKIEIQKSKTTLYRKIVGNQKLQRIGGLMLYFKIFPLIINRLCD